MTDEHLTTNELPLTDIKEIARWDLLRYRDAKRDIKHLRDIIMRQQSKAEKITRALDPEWLPVQRDNPGPIELLCAIADMQVEYRTKQIAAEHICYEIEQRICDWTSGIEQRILRSHYLFDVKLIELTDEYYCYRQIKRLHRKALEHYGDNLKVDPLSVWTAYTCQ